ncbi:beta/gamma crystallin domain-containing protein [Nocardia sp. NPDC006044]|uniref:beta/gamma crystallin domain-containing protein n=1 Tax=Nocardia sp. NPDC006044 TaxID=3364306 RepID=UPI0036C4F19D
MMRALKAHGNGDFDHRKSKMLYAERQRSMKSNTGMQSRQCSRHFGSMTHARHPRHATFRAAVVAVVIALLCALSSLATDAPANALPINKTPCDGRNDLAHVVMHFWGQAEEHCYANDGAMNVDFPDVTYISSGNNYLKVDAPGQQDLCLSPWGSWTNGSARPLQVKYLELSRTSLPC